MDFYKRYQEEIDLFFRQEYVPTVHDKIKGHVWVAGRSRSFQALTVEPPEGGQYEIAVRFPMDCGNPNTRDKYSGYIAREDGSMIGRNTDGH
ncbi:hypothetical protein KAR91_21750 [Candidatus Pacearchaeota archaeon]|nr:hypothetical protein [Candidatus Pacearchaeota archaeon]